MRALVVTIFPRFRAALSCTCFRSRQAGVAIVAVLAVLTIMALLAMCFAVLLTIEVESSRASQGRVQSEMMAQSGVQHAMSLLRQDTVDQPGWDDRGDPRTQSASKAGERNWRLVRGGNGIVLGRYTFEIEDESGKININVAAATSGKEQDQGVGPFELLLSDGRGRGLPISTEMARKAVQYRYGPDSKPGRAGVDDNLTASRYQGDEIDNNANGIVDEPGEGVDEQEEYSATTPRGDDRVFMSVSEMLATCGADTLMDEQSRLAVRRLATVDSRSSDTFWDDRIGGWQNRVNINVADRNQVMDVLTRANTDGQFEPVSRNLNQLGANIQDYRDQNHVLTTVGNEYGVESVCFNEVLAYDAGFTVIANSAIPNSYGWFYFTCCIWTPGTGAPRGAEYRWRFASFSTTSISLKEPLVTEGNMPVFLRMDKSWPRDFWKDADVRIYTNADKYYTCKATGNPETGSRRLSIEGVTAQQALDTDPDTATVTVDNGWRLGYGPWCQDPGRNETYFVHPPPRYPLENYYRVYSTANMYDPDPKCAWHWGGGCPAVSKCPQDLDVDGDVNKHSETLPIHGKYVYKEGQAQKPNREGYIPITFTSSLQCRNNNADFESPTFRGNMVWEHGFVRPDIVELMNISGKPISLKNWAIVVNTGKDALDLARVDKARHFSVQYGAQFDDPNPTIPSNGYFYLTNNREIFSIEHASGNSEYGGTPTETIPVCDIPQEGWGIKYKVIKTDWGWLKVEGADWNKDQMAGEMIQAVITRKKSGQIPADGHIFGVDNSNKDTLFIGGGVGVCGYVKVGDYIRIMGLPRQGGFVSFTLKNEYNQVVARTLEYGSVDLYDFGYSTQKYDPTHYTWVTTKTPTMGGNDSLARNMKNPMGEQVQPHIKNNDYVGPVELQKVRKAKDWENLGSQDAGTTRRALQAITKYVTVSGIRLDAEEEGAHLKGWNPAFGSVALCDKGIVTVKDAHWSPGMWGNSRLRVLSGASAGEEFIITNNSESSLQIVGYSTALHRTPSMKQGDQVSVGPGYVTSFYYTRTDGDEGEWEWKNKDIEPGVYGLYLYGLNDSINTTEFLEENWNAEIEASIFNFRTRAYEPLPLEGRQAGAFYSLRGTQKRVRYTKSDGVYCGAIGPDHVSAYRGIKLKLVSHSTGQKMCSGFAWFNYAYLAPGSTSGRINVNTAQARVLAALPGITPALATNIALGTPATSGRSVKPYRQMVDLLNVRGITPEEYGSICNLVTVRSDHYRVRVVGQSVADADGTFDRAAGDKVVSESRLDMLLDRSDLTSVRGQGGMFHASPAR